MISCITEYVQKHMSVMHKQLAVWHLTVTLISSNLSHNTVYYQWYLYVYMTQTHYHKTVMSDINNWVASVTIFIYTY